MSGRVAVVDANVLYSIELTDVLLTLATQHLVRLHWSAEILDEVRRNLALRPDLAPGAIDYRIDQMNAALPGALDQPPQALVDEMSVNQKDRHVLALAVHVEAATIVTFNLRDFSAPACEPHGIEAISPDDFLVEVVHADPDGTIRGIEAVARRRTRPAMTAETVLDRLASTVPSFAAEARRHLTTGL